MTLDNQNNRQECIRWTPEDGATNIFDSEFPQGDAPAPTVDTILAFGVAWANSDLNMLNSMITDDCVYAASVGEEPGTTYRGREEVERGFREILEIEAGTAAKQGEIWLIGNRAVSEWSLIETNDQGKEVEVKGVDLFEFEGTKIRRKEAYIKTYGN